MSVQPARRTMTIGDALALLRPDFPDVTVSKIRFLEAEGLIEPQRTPSGYRKFTPADVDRLRFILSAQRDRYLPLRVIKEYLQARDRGEEVDPPWAAPARPARAPRRLVAADGAAAAPGEDVPDVRLTRRQLLDGAAADEELLAELEDAGLVRRTGRHYGAEALAVTRAAAALGRHGVQVRHLRAVKAAADRELGLIEQAVAPLLRRRGPGGPEEAERTARAIADLLARVHAALVCAGLRETLDR
ncbi:transcriptional regulator FtsR [Thermomonospora cellulosilytica]|uniref:DNA-binding transcriptional MerR regulator n=1 Tax=Thermomonospora cellulosilytica TaxID=1411118 RepID=A0A7W3RA94_9ACTN|nr:MerR family transcriptional regulator [Thermomonospora cellulosilytica]MBA9005626.1 DNA-binding transcriptional MerR regulator [Thermomonospora cellulosilytica]